MALGQDAYKTAPDNYRLEFENEWTRISRATFRPGDKIPVHEHPPSATIYVYLTDGGKIRFSHSTPNRVVERPEVKAGAIRFTRGMAEIHDAEYLGSAQSEYLRIEAKTKVDLPQRTMRLAADNAGPIDSPQVRVRRTSCAAGDACMAEYPTVVVSIDKQGASWIAAGQRLTPESTATNLILVEFKSNSSGN